MKSWALYDTKPKYHLVVEVGRGRVMTALLEVVKNETLWVKNIYQSSIYVDEHDLHDEQHRLHRYKNAARQSMAGIDRSRVRRLQGIAVVYDAPWGGSFWKEEKEARQKPIKYTESVRDTLQKKAIKQYQAISGGAHRQALLGLTPIHEKLNGYHFQKPFGKRAEEISVTFQFDLVSAEMKKELEEVIAEEMPHHRIVSYARDALLYEALGHFVPKDRSDTLFVFVDDVRTSIIMRTNHGAVEKRVVQVGLESVIQHLTTALQQGHDQAHHLLHLYFAGRLESKLTFEIKEICADVGRMWQQQVKQGIGQVLLGQEFPERVLYTISDSFLRIIARDNLEEVVRSTLPQDAPVTFFDFRDNVLVADGPGVVSDQVVHLYVSTLL